MSARRITGSPAGANARSELGEASPVVDRRDKDPLDAGFAVRKGQIDEARTADEVLPVNDAHRMPVICRPRATAMSWASEGSGSLDASSRATTCATSPAPRRDTNHPVDRPIRSCVFCFAATMAVASGLLRTPQPVGQLGQTLRTSGAAGAELALTRQRSQVRYLSRPPTVSQVGSGRTLRALPVAVRTS